MKRRQGPRVAAIGWLVLVSALGPEAHGRTPLELNLEVATGPPHVQQTRDSTSGVTLVLNAMSEPQRLQLAGSLAKLAAAADKKKNPFFVSLDDSEERAAVENLIAQTAPGFTAASTLCMGRWQSREGDVQIRPVARCAAQTHCVSLTGATSDDAADRRARFLAWPLGYAILLSVAPQMDSDKVARALRGPDSTHIALALTNAELHALRRSPALSKLLKHAGHVAKIAPEKRSPLLDTIATIAAAATVGDEVPWLKLPSDAILVVPRLGSLATSDAFVAEVRTRMPSGSAHVEWLASPR